MPIVKTPQFPWCTVLCMRQTWWAGRGEGARPRLLVASTSFPHKDYSKADLARAKVPTSSQEVTA